MSTQRSKVLSLYRKLQYLGRQPINPTCFQIGMRDAFKKNAKECNPGMIYFISCSCL